MTRDNQARPVLKFTVPLVPPGVNHYVKHTRSGRHYVTAEASAFKQAVAIYARGRSVQGKSFSVTLMIVLGKGDRGDVDGFPKLVLDGMADCGIFEDRKGKRVSDAYVRDLRVILDCDARPEHGSTEITVEALQ